MSLRIRSTKTQLEDLGEDAEGAAENVSKLREQMLALTGVDIQLNKNTYKSTYQILLEMSKVWDKLDDMTQASVLEQLFGKRQANIGAAILSNGELLQQVYETSEKASDGIGSAMREQEEYAKSIQYNLDSLKASYQKLSQQIVQSETVVAIVKALNEALQSLSSSEIIVGINAVSRALISLTKTAVDVKDKLEDIPVAGNFVSRGLDEVRGIGFLKSAAKIYEWLNKDEKAAEEAAIKQEELNSKYEKSLKVYDEESESLRSLETEYLKLVANTQDAESAKEGLLALQNSVTERYGDEADGLNLVNKSLEENVKWLIERQKVLDESFVKENKEVIEQAKSKFGVESADEKSKHGFGNLSFGDESEIDNEARREVKLYTRAVSEYLKQYYPDIFESAITEGEYGFGINAGITPREQERAAELLVKAYEQAFEKYKNLQNKVLDTDEIKEYQRQWVESISKSVDILEKASKATENVDIIESFIGNKEDSDRFSELLLELNQFNDILNSDTSSFAEKIDASNEINQTVDALNDIAQKYPAIADLINQQIESVGLSFNHVTDTFETAKSAWLKNLDEAQKGVITNVDKITDAMKKIYQGDAIDSKAAWDIINLDNSKLLANIQIDQNGNYQFRVEELVALKDKLIEKEIEHQEEIINTAKINKESAEAEIATAKVQLESVKVRLAAAKAPNSMATNVKELENEYNRLESGISTTEDAVTAYDYAIRNASLYSDELRRKMGDLSGTTEILQARVKKLKDEVSQLNTEADNVLKAYEASVDDVIKKYEAEVNEIEKSKKGLEDQLKILEEQENELEQIVENHKAVSSIVADEVEAQISAIEDSRKEVEDYYDNFIEKLKTENEEREDAIEYEKKLANLANAQNNKVRVYDQERGWTYQVSKEALEEAENDLESYKKNQEIKALENEKEAKLKGYDDQIEAFEDYSKEWSKITESVDKAEDERLATEILGSEWREKIKNKDTSMMNSFKSSYQNYTTQLNSVVKNEINALNDSIKAKDKEIEAKREQIQVWQDYKNEIKSAADTIKNGLEDYVEYLGNVKINEQSTNEQRLAALNEFATKYRSIIDSITDKNGEIDNLEKQIDGITESMSNFKLGATGGTLLGGITTGMQVSNAFGGILQALVKAFEQLFGSMPHFAKGGTAGFTGMAYLDGTPHSAETIFTAAQSKKLYEYVNAMPEISKMFSVRSDALTGKTMDNSAHVSIGSMTVVANNPQEFANQFDKQMARYWKTKLTENKLY